MSYKDLFNKIKNNQTGKIYLLYGVETYLKDKYAEALKNKLISKELEDLNFCLFDDKNFTIGKMINACETSPFMSEKKLVFVKIPELFSGKQKFLTETDENELIHYLKNIPETTCLIFYAGLTIDSRRKVIKEIKKQGEIINFEKLKENELKEWIEKKIKNYKKNINNAQLSYFMSNIDYLGKNAVQHLMDIENEIKKIISFMGEREEVNRTDIDYAVSFTFQNDIFKLFDAIGRKNTGEALKRLNGIINQGEAPIKILFSLSSYIGNLLKIKLLLEKGCTASMIISELKMNSYYFSRCAEQSNSFTVKELKDLLNLLLKTDFMIKTGKIKESLGLEILVMEITGKK